MPVTIEPMPHRKNLLIPEVLKRNNFDLIRLILAIAVLFSHCYVLYYGMEGSAREPLQVFTRGQSTFGHLAVDCFFIISGFLIINSFFHSRSVGSYLRKRALRICPGFIVAFLLSVFFFALLGNIEYQRTIINWGNYFQSLHIRKLIFQFLFFKQPTHTVSFTTLPVSSIVNGSLWTIQYEWICYLVLPVLGVAGAIKSKWVGLTMFLLFYCLMILQHYTGFLYFETHKGMWILNMNNIPRFFAYFFAGISVYLYRAIIPRNTTLMLISVAALVLSSVLTYSFNLIFPIAGTYLLFYLAYSKKIQFYDFAKKADLSYGVYLYAWPIQQLTLYCLSPYITLFQLFFLSLLLTILTAYFWSWKCIEKPFMEFKKHKEPPPAS